MMSKDPGSIPATFWMVYLDGAEQPKRRHSTLQEACTEAERLAKSGGRTAFVLQVVRACVVSFDWVHECSAPAAEVRAAP